MLYPKLHFWGRFYSFLMIICFSSATQAQSIIIDNFSKHQHLLRILDGFFYDDGTGNPIPDASLVNDSGIFGGQRDLLIAFTGPKGSVGAATTAGGSLVVNFPINIMSGSVALQWDGDDCGSCNEIYPFALVTGVIAGTDLTNGGLQNGFLITIEENNAIFDLVMTVHSNYYANEDFSSITIPVPITSTPIELFIPFDNFPAIVGGADFTFVKAVTAEFILNPGSDAASDAAATLRIGEIITTGMEIASPAVPTLSQWGLFILALLLMITGTLSLIQKSAIE